MSKRSQLQVLDGLREFGQLYVLQLLRQVHVLHGGEGASRGCRDARLQTDFTPFVMNYDYVLCSFINYVIPGDKLLGI